MLGIRAISSGPAISALPSAGGVAAVVRDFLMMLGVS